METVKSVSSHQRPLFRHSVNYHNHPLHCKVSSYNPCHLRFTSNKLSVSYNSNKAISFLNLDKNPCLKSSSACGFSNTDAVTDVSSAGSLIRECVDNGLYEDAVNVYLNLLGSGSPVEGFKFFPCLVKAFGWLYDANKGRQIHGHLLKLGVLDDVYIRNSLLGMYWKCGAGGDAVKLFQKMEVRDLVSWSTTVSGFCQLGDFVESLTVFSRMIEEYGCTVVNRVAYLSAISSCTALESWTYGRAVHGFIIKNELDSDEFLVSGLIEMYMKCRDTNSAEHVFRRIADEELARSNMVIWNVRILGYVYNELLFQALHSFVGMLELGINPDSSTAVALLVLCAQLLDIAVGKQVHRIIVGFGLEKDIRVATALMEMYFKCGYPEAGMKIFRGFPNYNLVMWGSIITNCAQAGYPSEALQLFCEYMLDYGSPDLVILLAALRACSTLSLKSIGMHIHGLAIKMGFDSDVFVGGALVDLYAACGDMEFAEEVFCQLPTRDLVAWNALISGFAQNKCEDKAVKSFCEMQYEQMKPDAVSLACILSVCAHLSVVILCKEVHCYLLRHGLKSNVLVNNSLISAYAKCGDMKSAWTVFEKMSAKNEVSWNSIILGFGMHGRATEMFSLFEKMKEKSFKPDHATFTAILSACSHAGMIEMAWKYFKSMVEYYNLEPRIEQYTCMVDLLGRAGHLKQAYNLIKNMPCSPDDRTWGSLLGSCKKYGDAELAEVVATHLFKLDPTSVGYRVLLANLYEEFGERNEVNRVRSEIKHVGLKKQPGCSWIEIGNNIHIFTASDYSHDQCEEIYMAIESLTLEMKRVGYIPQLQSVNICADEGTNVVSLSEGNS